MPKTTKEKNLDEQIADARAEHAATEKRIAELTDELAGIPGQIGSVDWSSDEERAVLEVATLERRRDALPHYLRHLRRQALEQEIALYRLETEEAESRRPALMTRVEEAQEAFDAARAVLNEAKGAQSDLVYGTLSDLRRNISEAQKRLAALENEVPVEAAPPVRSVWQMNRPGPENYPQDTPKSMHWGAANVADKPLSVEAPENVVIPERALEEHDRPGRER